MSAPQEALKWISLDWSKILYMVLWILYMVPLYNIFGLISLRKRVIKWGSFIKNDFFCENNLIESNK